MPKAIYYFSATGNSLSVARHLAQKLGDTRIIAVTKALKDNREQPFDTVGIVYPVYMFGLPQIIEKFLKNINLRPSAYIFSVATLGGLPGRAHTLVKNILQKRGLKLAAGFSVLMPGNYTPLYEAIPEEKQQGMFKEETKKIEAIAEAVLAGKRGIIEEKPLIINYFLYRILYKGGMSLIPSSGKHFWVNQACSKCGLCAKICPVENIQMGKDNLKWLDHCQQCMACLQWCPTESIQYKKKTPGRKRYHHPQISAQDILQQRE
ncbi:MAG: EFR1 family ferrodoxin [Candidatus Omnitrophota bacterium]